MPRGERIPGLSAFWRRHTAALRGVGRSAEIVSDPRADAVLLAALRLGIRETLQFLTTGMPSLEEFGAWVLAKNGGAVDPVRMERLRGDLEKDARWELESILPEPVLSAEDLRFWDENGYILVKQAVCRDQAQAAVDAIFAHAGMRMDEPDSWYRGDIWIPLAHDPALWANRNSERVHTAFSQVWGQKDLWMNVDVCGVNPPLREGYGFRGTALHWDMSIAPRRQFGTQAILYLTDTAANQGAFSCVPGFHRRIEAWLEALPEGADARALARAELRAVPIAGEAGDLIIWNQALPHAATPNVASSPRVVQYLNMFSGRQAVNATWL